MKPIELCVPVRIEKIETILSSISQASLFVIKSDPYRKPTSQKAAFQIFNKQADSIQPKLVCFLELTRKKENLTTVKISQEDSTTQQEMLPATGSPFTRFVSMLSQHLYLKA